MAIASGTEAPFADVQLRDGRHVILRLVHPADKNAEHAHIA